jgi:hypothetical protein
VAPSCAAELKKQLLSRRLVNASDILGGTHCLAPACIRASLASSLAKLRLETLDLLYLHNPAEVQLEARGKAGFFEVLRTAFKVGEGGSVAGCCCSVAGYCNSEPEEACGCSESVQSHVHGTGSDGCLCHDFWVGLGACLVACGCRLQHRMTGLHQSGIWP